MWHRRGQAKASAQDGIGKGEKIMSYTLLSQTTPKARKEHRCIWCGETILKGKQYTAERSVFDGEMQNHHWHPECLEDCRLENSDECEYEFLPYEHVRPEVV